MDEEKHIILTALINGTREFKDILFYAFKSANDPVKCTIHKNQKYPVDSNAILYWLSDKLRELEYYKNETAEACPAIVELMQFVEFFCENNKILKHADKHLRSLVDNIWNDANDLLDDKLRENSKAHLIGRRFNAVVLEIALVRTLIMYDKDATVREDQPRLYTDLIHPKNLTQPGNQIPKKRFTDLKNAVAQSGLKPAKPVKEHLFDMKRCKGRKKTNLKPEDLEVKLFGYKVRVPPQPPQSGPSL